MVSSTGTVWAWASKDWAVALTLAVLTTAAAAGTTEWLLSPPETGDWFDANNWSDGVPDARATARMVNGGTVVLTGGQAEAWEELIGGLGLNRVVQTGGVKSIGSSLSVGTSLQGEAVYELGGSGQLWTAETLVGDCHEAGRFIQTGGTHGAGLLDVSGSGSVYTLSGPGQLTVGRELVGRCRAGQFNQSGGSHTVDVLTIYSEGRMELTGGQLQVQSEMLLNGELDFGGSETAVSWDGVFVNWSYGTILNARNASFSLGPDSVLMLSAETEPNEVFGEFECAGRIHRPGQTLVIPVGMTVTAPGTIRDHVRCEGTIGAGGGGPDLEVGLELRESGSVNIPSGSITIENEISGMAGGALLAAKELVGDTGHGRFVQAGGSSRVRNLYVGKETGAVGVYEQTGGTSEVKDLSLGEEQGAEGSYVLNAGNLTVTNWESQYTPASVYVGSHGSGTFRQNGGTARIEGYLYLGRFGTGACVLTGGDMEVTEPSASAPLPGRTGRWISREGR